LSIVHVCQRLTYYLGEINAIHPFREGNGRTQRLFIQLSALEAGYDLDFSRITDMEMIEASTDTFLCDYAKMFNIIKKSLSVIRDNDVDIR
jgi:cell filamentation protein